ncbi:MAG: proton-conducting transporter membrane subunit, partial [Luteococcus japonicus]
EPYFCPMVLVLMAGVAGALMTADLFNLFVFIEVMLLPSYGLMMLAHRGQGRRMQVTATRIYVSVNLLTSSLMLIGIAVLYASLGRVDFGGLVGGAVHDETARLGTAIVLLALGTKSAVVPVHGWLGRTYPHMSPALSALFSGLHTKVSLVALFRVHSVLFAGQDTWTGVALVVFVTSMAVGVLAAVGQSDARAILSFHMVSQIGYILIGLALHTPVAVAAGLFYLVHNVLAKASLFLSSGAVEIAYGRHALGEVSGLLRRERLTSLAFFVAAMSLAGMPPLSGFVAKLALIAASFDARQWWVGAAALVVSLFTMMSMLKIWGSMFLGEPQEPDEEPRISLALILPGLVLAAAGLVLGLAGEPLLDLCHTAADQLLTPSTLYAEGPR